MYKIKQIPKDFFVKEVVDLKLDCNGSYSYFKVTKVNYTTLRAVEAIARALNIDSKKIGFSGTKDKFAVTVQYFSVPFVKQERLEKVSIKDLKLEYVGKGNDPLFLGNLKGNKFKIVVRNIHELPNKINKFKNFYGRQRFSTNNIEIGRALVKKDFKTALNLLKEFDDEKEAIIEHLEFANNDFIGALRKINKRRLQIYIHAYQSFLWNEMAKISNLEEIPILGFGTKLDDATKQLAGTILDKEGIKLSDFIFRQFPELSSSGNSRKSIIYVSDVEFSRLEDDEFNPSMKKTTVSFSLPKGAYATVFIDELFK